MPQAIRFALIGIGVVFLTVGFYHRIQSQRSGERLHRSKEGLPILVGIRLLGLTTLASVVAWLWNPRLFEWAEVPVPEWVRWIGVAVFASAVAWLIWMFHTLGRNLTDTVVTRKDAYFVDYGPYRIVRNPMYTGILMTGFSLGVALGTWWLPALTVLVFLLLALRTRTEERYLIERFGDQYRDYIKRVGRFFPKLRG